MILLTYCIIGTYSNYFRVFLFEFCISKAQSLSSEVNHLIESGQKDLIKKQVIKRIGRTGYILFACENWKTVYHPFEKEEINKLDIEFLKKISFNRSGSGSGEHIDNCQH